MKRYSFASIDLKSHPHAHKYKFKENDLNFNNNPNNDDIDIVEEIIDFIRTFKLNSSTGTGEWEFLQKNKQNEYIFQLNELNKSKLTNLYANMFRNEVTYGYLSPSFNDIRNNNENCSIKIWRNFSWLNRKDQKYI